MQETLFANTVENSLVTSAAIIAVLLIGALLKKRYNLKWRYLIWLVIAIRLLIPFNPDLAQAPLSLAPLTQTLTWALGQIEGYQQNSPAPAASAESPAAGGVSSTVAAQKPAGAGIAANQGTAAGSGVGEQGTVFPAIWLGGMLAFLAYHLFRYGYFMRSVKRWGNPITNERIITIFQVQQNELGIKHKIAVRSSQKVPGPMMTGLFRPIILLPDENYADQDLEVILKHELIHFKRKDLWYKLVLLLANALHWFNPVVYWMYRTAERDMELTCDDEVVGNEDMDYRKSYSEAILLSLQKQKYRQSELSTYFHGGKRNLKERFSNLFETKKKRGTAAFCLALALVLAASVLVAAENKKAGTTADTPSDANLEFALLAQDHSLAKLYQYKTPYIGDNSKVGAIVGELPLPEGVTLDKIELQTTEEPYRLTVDYTVQDRIAFRKNYYEKTYQTLLLRNDAVLFSLIGNVQEIAFDFFDQYGEAFATYTNLDLLNNLFETDYFTEDRLKAAVGTQKSFNRYLAEIGTMSVPPDTSPAMKRRDIIQNVIGNGREIIANSGMGGDVVLRGNIHTSAFDLTEEAAKNNIDISSYIGKTVTVLFDGVENFTQTEGTSYVFVFYDTQLLAYKDLKNSKEATSELFDTFFQESIDATAEKQKEIKGI